MNQALSRNHEDSTHYQGSYKSPKALDILRLTRSSSPRADWLLEGARWDAGVKIDRWWQQVALTAELR